MNIFEYELIDCGEKRKLERIGNLIVDRPCPQAIWKKKMSSKEWARSDAYYDRKNKKDWSDESYFPDPWNIRVGPLTLELKPSQNNQVGIFPEQWENWKWIHRSIENARRPLNILNLFAYTGVASLIAATSGEKTTVCHVDGSKASVERGKTNQKLSHAQETSIRWIVDDVPSFVKREIQRGNTYDGIILDPPSFGRGKKKEWQYERDLPLLLEDLKKILSKNPCFVLCTGHTPGVTHEDLAKSLDVFKPHKGRIESFYIKTPSTKGNALPSGMCARIQF